MKSAPYMDGWRAQGNFVDQSRNPYDETTQPYSNEEWLLGWCARYAAIKHGLSLDLDENNR